MRAAGWPSVFVKLTVEQNILAILEMLHVGRRERQQIRVMPQHEMSEQLLFRRARGLRRL